MTFVLQSNKEGRVILDKHLHLGNAQIREIEASSWIEARASIHEFEFVRSEGYGWFAV